MAWTTSVLVDGTGRTGNRNKKGLWESQLLFVWGVLTRVPKQPSLSNIWFPQLGSNLSPVEQNFIALDQKFGFVEIVCQCEFSLRRYFCKTIRFCGWERERGCSRTTVGWNIWKILRVGVFETPRGLSFSGVWVFEAPRGLSFSGVWIF